MNADQVLNNTFRYKAEGLTLSIFYYKIIKRLPFNLGNQIHVKSLCKKKNRQSIEKIDMLQIEISSEKINQLLAQRLICAADIRCLDTGSKQCLTQLCLTTCLNNTKTYNSKTVNLQT